MNDSSQQNISNKSFHEPILINGEKIINPSEMGIIQDFFPLTEYQFYTLVDRKFSARSISINTAFVGMGLLIPIISKLIGEAKIERWEWISVGLAFALSLIILIIGLLINDPKMKLIKVINKFFKRHESR